MSAESRPCENEVAKTIMSLLRIRLADLNGKIVRKRSIKKYNSFDYKG